MRRTYTIILGLLLAFVTYGVIDSIWLSQQESYLEYNSPTDQTIVSELAYYDISEYYQYIDSHDRVFPSTETISVEGVDFTDSSGDEIIYGFYEGVDESVFMDETGSLTWEVTVPQTGYYNLNVNYYPYPGKSSSIERTLYINGEIPFDGANNIIFHRIWGNATDVIQDLNGNDVRPSQIELPRWTSTIVNDSVGYIDTPYMFYFEQGVNTITLESVREPMLIESIEVMSVEDNISYLDYYRTIETLTNNAEDIITIQGEDQSYTSSPTIYQLNDRTSALTVPSDPTLIKLNTIGGNNWRVSGDFIVWDFEVEESGFYEISMRVKQRLATGMNVYRNIYIDDEIPFEELSNYAYEYDNAWRTQTLGTDTETYKFYLEEGEHELKMEVSLGEYGPIIGQVQSVINNLNELYREIIIYTGPEPDTYRDYQLEDRIDNLIERIETERANLDEIRTALIEIAGSKSEKTGILDTVILQLDDFLETPREIHTQLSTFNSNISSLGTLILLLSSQPLEVDYIMFHSADAELPRTNANTFESLWYSVQAFVSTFTTDYSSIGQTSEANTEESVEVWLSIGRDQANVLRKLIDESFTPTSNINIDLKLVNGSVLLPATLADVGPDVAMGLGNSIPVNYAMRNAVYDISEFDDFDQVVEDRFMDSAMVPFEYEGGYYALPEQQIFLMMFYRTDIFEELGLEPPETWDDVIRLIPDLQKHNLEFYLPVPITQGAVMNLPPNPIFSTLFYQNDGEFYLDDNTRSGFNDGAGPEVFEMWTQFYTDYSFPVEANFVNRFRSGQMPIGITYYNVYNNLSVFAPEIRGKWDFLPVPGTLVESEDGDYIRRETVSTGTATMIMENCENKEAAWEFLKWWTSTDTQVQFGREMEGILGAAARYPSANKYAIQQLPWTVEEYEKLNEQWEWVVGIPEVPGGYMTGRHLDNAFRMVYNESTNPRETIYDYVLIIDEEIAKKRKEFGLD